MNKLKQSAGSPFVNITLDKAISVHKERNLNINIIDKDIECIEFAPDIFEHIRQMDGLRVDDLRKSMDPEIEENAKRIFSAGESMGKSGSFFFFSHDQRFLIKTMFTEEFDIFMQMFKYYFEHLNNYKDSLMARIYGIYSIKMEGMTSVYLILMAFTKKCDDRYVKRVFDLKGSMINREEKGKMKNFKNTKTLKDVNFLSMQKEEHCLLFQSDDIRHIVQQMGKDVALLCNFGIMDYSLFFCVEHNPEYVKMHPYEYVCEDGEVVFPVKELEKKD